MQKTIASQFQVCWNCGTNENGVADDSFAKEIDVDELADAPEIPRVQCRRCDYRGKVLFSSKSKKFVDWVIAGLISISVSQRSWIQFCHQVCPKCDAPQLDLSPWAGEPSTDDESLWLARTSKEELAARKQKAQRLFLLALRRGCMLGSDICTSSVNTMLDQIN